MSLFRCGFTIQRQQTPEQPENSEDIESEQTVPACFPRKESTSLGDVEYNAVVSSVADIVTPSLLLHLHPESAENTHTSPLRFVPRLANMLVRMAIQRLSVISGKNYRP